MLGPAGISSVLPRPHARPPEQPSTLPLASGLDFLFTPFAGNRRSKGCHDDDQPLKPLLDLGQ